MPTRTSTSLIAAVCLVVPMLVGCQSGTAPDDSPTTQPRTTTAPDAGGPEHAVGKRSGTVDAGWDQVRSSDGTYLVAYDLEPDEIPLNEPFGLRVRVFDGDDPSTLLNDVELSIDGRMPHHRHGMNRVPSVERSDDGTFQISNMLFHMPGYWELHFDITRGMTTERAQVEVTLE